LQTFKTFGNEAFTPLTDGVAVTVKCGGDVLVGRVVGCGGEQDDAAAEGKRLGSGAGTLKSLKFGAEFWEQLDD
jgi:hypothetical protein